MISEKQKQIIKALMNAKDGYNINQIARITNLSPSWTFETLKLLEKQGYLISVKLGNAVFFKMNWQDLKTQKVTELILLEEKYSATQKEYNVSTQNLEKIENNKTVQENTEPRVEIKQNFYSKNEQLQNNFSYSPKIIQGNSFNYNQSQQPSNGSLYGIVPIGSQGINSVLGQYATSGAFGSSAYDSSSNYNSINSVPPNSLGYRISNNIESFTLKDHTTSHINNAASGCRYCGPEVKIV